MQKLLVAVALTLVVPVDSSAHSGACDARAAIGGAASLLPLDMPVDGGLAGDGRHVLAKAVGLGLEGSVQASVPVGSTWSLTTEFGAGRRGVEVYREHDGTDVRRRTGDAVKVRHFHVGFMVRRQSRYLCGYTSFGVGPYRFSYRGSSARVLGAAARMGFEVPSTESLAVFFEVGLAAALNKAQPPLTPASVVAGVRPAAGLRYRF